LKKRRLVRNVSGGGDGPTSPGIPRGAVDSVHDPDGPWMTSPWHVLLCILSFSDNIPCRTRDVLYLVCTQIYCLLYSLAVWL
ncbi:unnamed protein product, partial [Pylaiella littoralis]